MANVDPQVQPRPDHRLGRGATIEIPALTEYIAHIRATYNRKERRELARKIRKNRTKLQHYDPE